MKTATQEKFENRVRFNWGYHDAAQCVRMEWDLAGKCFGGSLSHVGPENVLTEHPDKSYANGWIRGYRDAMAKKSTSSSEPAWLEALAEGCVSY